MRLMAFALLAMLLAQPVRADDKTSPTFDFTKVLADLSGKPMTYCGRPDDKDPTKCAEEKPWTLGAIATLGLTMIEANEDGIAQTHRSKLAEKIYNNAAAGNIDPGDVGLICDLIPKFVAQAGARGGPVSPLLTLRAWEILCPARINK